MKKKILQLTTVHPSLDTRIFQRFARAVSQENNFDSILINANDDNFSLKNVKIMSPIKFKNIFHRIFFVQIRIYKKIVEIKPDLIHFHDPELIILGFFLKMRGFKIIYDVHENYQMKFKSKKGPVSILTKFFIPFIYKILINLICKKFDAITCASVKLKKKYDALNEKVINIENFSMFEIFDKNKLKLKKKDFKKKLIYTGGITHYRGAETIINVFDKYKENDYELIICGRVNIKSLAKKLEKKLLNPRIKNIGKIKIEEVFKLMSHSSIGVLLNEKVFDYDNAVPNKLFEYISLGLPIIASNFGVWRDVIEKYHIGEVCDPNNLEEIDNGIKKIFNNYDYYIDNYLKSHELIKKEFLWNYKKNRLINLYNSMFN